MGGNDITIISAPEMTDDQYKNLAISLKAHNEGNIYLTRAKMTPMNKDDVIEWFEALTTLIAEMGWDKDVKI